MNDFIQKTIDDFNKKERKRIELERKSLKIENGKVYEYRTVYFDDPDNLDSVYIPGDVIDFTTIEKYDDKDIYIDYHNCIIKSVEKSNAGSAGYITVTGGYKNGENAVLTAVNLGDDTDTVGAITGGIAGIIYGLNAIPEEWVSKLVNKMIVLNAASDLYKKCNKDNIIDNLDFSV